MHDRHMHVSRGRHSGTPASVRRAVVRQETEVKPGRTDKKRSVFAAILLDALRGSRRYVSDFSAGRGAE
jgi:hypothetical protein